MRIVNGETIEISSSSVVKPFIVNSYEEEGKEEHVEHRETSGPPSTPSLPNDKDLSTEAHSFITIPLKTFHKPQASILQCFKESSQAKLLKDLCTQDQKSRNHFPKKILRSKQLGYIRWRNILSKGYQILKKKGWKGLVGHPNDRGKHCILIVHFIFHISIHVCVFIFRFIFFLLTAIDLMMPGL
jgi:hypothetical protein